MKKVLILTSDQAYAPSQSSSSAVAGLTPDILAYGAIGLYGLVTVDSTTAANVNQYCLLYKTSGGTTGITQSDTGKVDFCEFVQGAATSPIRTGWIQPAGVSRIVKQAYTAPVKQVAFIGYDGNTGVMNLPTLGSSTPDTTWATMLAVQKEVSTIDQIRNQQQQSVGGLLSSSTGYDIFSNLVIGWNNIPTSSKQLTTFVTGNGSVADYTGTANAILFTKGSTTAQFVIEGASGFTASTGTVSAGDVIFIAHSNMKSVTFTANILGTGAGHHIITIGGTQYVVADAGTAAQNATAIAAAINAGTQATATVSTADVTITLLPSVYSAKINVVYSADDSTWVVPTLTVNTTTGETVGSIYKASAAVSTAASFELDRPYRGETGYYHGGTSTSLNCGIMTSITQYGIKAVADNAGEAFTFAKQGVIENSTLTYSVGASKGLGTGAEVVKIEDGLIAYRGQFDTVDRRMKQLPKFANASSVYDAYNFYFENRTFESGFSKRELSTLIIFVPRTNNSANTGVSDFETVVKGWFTSAVCNF
jgi:hypothetical protein